MAFETVSPEGLDAADTSQIIAMAWDDSTSFEAIALNYGLDEAQVIALMRQHLKARSFQVWRMRSTCARTSCS